MLDLGIEDALSLSGLAKRIAVVVQRSFAGERFWVISEVIGFKVSRGHCYLQLAEKDENAVTPKAEFRAIIWAGNFERLNARFVSETGTTLRENIRILCNVEVQFHERYGLSLIVHDLDPAFTLGQLELERKRTIERLKREGIFTNNKERTLPLVVQRIAVISSADSKGYEDFITRLSDNPYGYQFDVKLYPSLLQGDLAAGDIITKLIAIYEEQIFRQADAVVIVRGGGGASSLECFNDYQLARAVARFPLPVLTGIGHTANRSVVDEVAYIDLLTPTDVAGFLVNRTAEFEVDLNLLQKQIGEIGLAFLDEEINYFEEAGHSLMASTHQVISDEQQLSEQLFLQVKYLSLQLLQNDKVKIDQLIQRAGINVKFQVEKQRRELLYIEHATNTRLSLQLKQDEVNLSHIEERIQLLDPNAVLKRGFSYTLYQGKILKETTMISTGDEVKTVLSHGTFESIIKSIDHGGEV